MLAKYLQNSYERISYVRGKLPKIEKLEPLAQGLQALENGALVFPRLGTRPENAGSDGPCLRLHESGVAAWRFAAKPTGGFIL
jgi:hypothetical protein